MADLTLHPVELLVDTAVRRGLQKGGEAILVLSDEGAPKEPEPKHGVHLTETGFVRVEPGVGADAVAVGYTAFWAVWQEEDLTYHHPNGGHAKFLSGALLAGGAAALELVGESVREALQ